MNFRRLQNFPLFLSLILLLAYSGDALAQKRAPRDRFCTAYGASLVGDFVKGPVNTYFTFDSLGSPESEEWERLRGQNYFSLMYRMRYNIFEKGREFALSLSLTPAFGVGHIKQRGLRGSLNLPLFLTAEFGAGANFGSVEKMGSYFGLGAEYNRFPLFSFENEFPDYKKDWVQPAFIAGFRYWSKAGNLEEISLKMGYSLQEKILGEENPHGVPWTFRLAWGTILSY